jgi:hypothetical protein
VLVMLLALLLLLSFPVREEGEATAVECSDAAAVCKVLSVLVI